MSNNQDDSQGKGLGSQIKGGAFKSVKAVGSVLDDFKAFLSKGNVVDLAVGLVMGAAFTAIVTSFVADLITPLIGLATQSNLENMFYILRCPANASNCREVGNYGTTAEANKVGVVTWNYGRFIQICINFVIISIIVFLIVKLYTASFRREEPGPVKDCAFCAKEIPLSAVRCPFCTSHVQSNVGGSSDAITKKGSDSVLDVGQGGAYRR
ncbi:hypothetical protein BASA50_007779 [Batrachochytrium salamandrivorans]|uniref:Large conductance mechanosensitive channel protein n=1 Tax=Batrachochytrium salamandrivorans TaxID=1357716 RepID=A0ABQ8F9D6_9FUNG|nr:hypothetical protein BASA62_002499 [Batrachochytrium salamandrivorans]KAH6576283.1 hypothetical protein BASA60_004582 [Batrachochytrium salamandrivorans]KAH6592942.1 hypothetical protein BASA50_007779 [Batrachochytrium salamandrivorans]KAH6603032.1 hypothetical protein BASA61_000513 [Batrachochytrium salamandrivorans]KAH9270219.1 large conductance mechanosensitive channel protein [Batrachochytrium salamandrivorans]